MEWNWQHHDWPSFTLDSSKLAKAEQQFLLWGGVYLGTVKHLDPEAGNQLIVLGLSNEAITTSAIEGEALDRDSVQSSLRRQMGLALDTRRAQPAEHGIAEMMVDLYRHYASPLEQTTLFSWHRMLTNGRTDLREVGRYRSHPEPMQIVSGKVWDPQIHFEAPPSERIPEEMDRFLAWFNHTAPAGASPLPAVTRAGIAHLYFECIHPFEDGNGRIGRAIAEKILAQSLGEASFTALSTTLLAHRKEYYRALEAANRRLDITNWLMWFAGIVLEARQRALHLVEFILAKMKLLDQVGGTSNDRQLKVLLLMLQEGPEGFKGGLSAGNYVSIARTSPATATRDLAAMVERGALHRTGAHRHARYHLPIPLQKAPRITLTVDGEIVME